MKELKQFVQVTLLAIMAVAVMGTWTPVAAQPAQDKLIDKISFGYKFYRVSQSSFSQSYPLGFYVDASGDLQALSGWDWMAEVTYARKSGSEDNILGNTDFTDTILFVGGGLKKEFEQQNAKFLPHCQGLVGFARFNSSSSGEFLGEEFDESFGESAFALKGSCGVDYVINPKWDVRGGAGYIRAFEDPGINIVRLFVGLVWRMQ